VKQNFAIPLTPGRGPYHPGRGPEWAGGTGRPSLSPNYPLLYSSPLEGVEPPEKRWGVKGRGFKGYDGGYRSARKA